MARGAIKGTTERDLANGEDGFAANGESQFTRRASQPGNMNFPGAVPKRRGKHTHAALIAENVSGISKLRGDLSLATDPVKRAWIAKNIGIKERFVARLKAE
jgi:hypothetical protein